jgi:hypothetical protein
MPNFYAYFKENMDALGLPAPESLFGSLQAAVANASVILTQIDKLGKAVTIGDLIGAGTRLEGPAVAGTLSASFYVGAVIGSIAVATGRSLSGDLSLSDVLLTAHQHNLNRPWLAHDIQRWSGVYNRKVAERGSYFHQAVIA